MESRIFCVVGPSSSGKTSFAIKLAKRLRQSGRSPVIISVDVMQMYAGLPVATNKPSCAEKEGIPHYFIGHLDPFGANVARDGSFCVAGSYGNPHNISEFIPKAVSVIKNLQAEGKTVIITGGTLYYVLAIMTDSLLPSHCETANVSAKKVSIRTMSTDKLYAELTRLDPEMARRWHPSDHRHIRRSLEVFYEKEGIKGAQAEKNQESAVLRWTDHVLFWIDCDMGWLYERIEARVAQMEENGLCAEVTEFYFRECLPGRGENAFSKAIGFKEFLPYLAWIGGARDRASAHIGHRQAAFRCHKASAQTRQLWAQCTADLVQKTRQYCTKQVRWIRNKMTTVEAFNIFRVATWDDFDSDRFLMEGEIDIILNAPLASVRSHSKRVAHTTRPHVERIVHHCSVCEKYLENDFQWQAHLSSRQHRKLCRNEQARSRSSIFVRGA